MLILLGDAMLGAHTVALNATGRRDRIINTQDVLHGALLPGLVFVLLCLGVAWWIGHRAARRAPAATTAPSPRVSMKQAALSAVTLAFLVALLAGVALGYFYAVEAAAMGAFTLFAIGIATRRLRGDILSSMLREVMATAGALFALLIGATTLTLMLRIYGTDVLVSNWITGLPGSERAVLLSLQASFLLPPFGYALMMARSAMKEVVPLASVLRSLAPFLVVQALVLIAVLVFPALVQLFGTSEL